MTWLAHRRLAILDLSSAGHQPMLDRDSRFVLAFNGEIYNFREVRSELESLGHGFIGSGDTEVLLAAWRQGGESCVGRLRGMFAFAIWDRKDEALWLVRDRLGEKPLYYTLQRGRLLFASELRTLLASDVVERRLDEAGLDSYLTFGAVSQPLTLLRDVRAVGAGELIRYRAGRLTHHTYWSLADIPERATSEPYETAVERVREAIDASVDLCTVSDVPVALLLSGGVDSTGILARLIAGGHTNVRTFSVVFDGADASFSEQEWSDAAAERFGSLHERVVVRGDDARSLLPRALAAVDQPSHDGFNHYLVLQAIAAAGYKVAITGQGADELFFGYGRHRSYRIARRLARLWCPTPLSGTLHTSMRRALPRRTSARKALALLMPARPDRMAYAVRHMMFTPFDVAGLRGTQPRSIDDFVPEAGGTSEMGRLYRLETSHFMRNQLLRDGDQMSMACSLELRAPFVDHRLVELVASMPAASKIQGDRQKPLLVDALDDDLVRRIAARPKVGFSFPLRRWLAEELTDLPIETERLGLRRTAVDMVKSEARAGGDHRREWMLLVLSDWARRHGIEA